MLSRIVLAIALSTFFSIIASGDVLADEITVPWYAPGCEQASIQCTASHNAILYVNGLSVATCNDPVTVTVTTRPSLTNTLTLISDDSITYELTPTCTVSMTAPAPITGTAVLPTPEVTTDTMGMQSVLGGGGFLGISFGGSLSNPEAPINQWLGIAEDFVDIINTGNILYIIGAVAGAGAVLSWAITKVKNPGM